MSRIVFLLMLLVLPVNGHAQEVFGEAITQGANIYASARPILNGLGLLGILGVAGMTMVGKMPWGWAFAVISGLVLVMLSGAIVNWVLQVAGVDPLPQGTAGGEFQIIADNINTASGQLFTDTRQLLYIFAGIGVIALGTLGLFGKFPWSWFFALVTGLVILGVADLIVASFLDNSGAAITVSAP